jgi:hypothetical protein
MHHIQMTTLIRGKINRFNDKICVINRKLNLT